jgi:dTDP-4-dehydrorhamnose 3,5-epimerase
MKVHETPLPGVFLVEPRVFRDPRGFFYESFQAERFGEHGLPDRFVQDNHSRSRRGVLRGLHYQLTRPQGKYVTAVRGEIFDVAVDIRRGSPTFGRWFGVTLSGDDPRYLYIPPGYAHGFCVLSEEADFVYKCTDVYVPSDERTVQWNDPAIGIEWPLPDPIVSDRDRAARPLAEMERDLPVYPDASSVSR